MHKSKGTSLAASGVFCLALAATIVMGALNSHPKGSADSSSARLSDEVRHRLAMLPYYGVFDNLQFQVSSPDTVILLGQVTNPTIRNDAESTVKHLEDVGKVVNKIEVLPLSSDDDSIRRAEFRAIYSKPGLSRYGAAPVPSIHIIVENGHVTLEGVVASKADENLATIAANEVPGIFGVRSNLRVEASTRRE